MKEPTGIVLSEAVPYCKISYSQNTPIESLPLLTCPDDAYQFLMEVWDDTISYKEEFLILLLNHGKRCLGWAKISSGGTASTIVEPAMVYQVALLSHAQTILLAHNHPSGNLNASTADIQITKRLIEAGKMLGIRVDDHLIITSSGYTSLMEQGLI